MSWLVLAVSLLPGLAVAKEIDATSDWLRRFFLAPSLGLLLLFTLAGINYLVGASMLALHLLIFIANSLAIYVLSRNREETWSQRQFFFIENRSKAMYPAIIVVALVCMLPLIFLDRPMGVDWIGFSAISDAILRTGTMELPSPSQGWWTYPPALPTLAAWNSSVTGVTTADSVFSIGQLSLLALLFGVMGAMDRHGAGIQSMLAMGLAAGLFAKGFDSGYPTVASHLGLVVGLQIVLEVDRRKSDEYFLIFALLGSALLHPSGAIMLGLLIISEQLLTKGGESLNRILVICSFALGAVAVIGLVVISPSLLEHAIFAEHGWQGGRPLLMYNGILLIVGGFAAYKIRNSIEGRILISWIALIWILTGIHLFSSLEEVWVFKVISASLYSMGMYAFHIPLAAIVGLWWSASTDLGSTDEAESLLMYGRDEHPPSKIVRALTISSLLFLSTACGIIVDLSNHEELQAYTDGDEAIHDMLSNLPAGSIVYNENSHWGHSWNLPEGVGVTAVPTLGMLHQTHSIQNAATTAIGTDDISRIQKLGITHAVTSPIGSMGWSIAASEYWEILADQAGSRLWRFIPEGGQPVSNFHAIEGDEMRPDPWREHRFRDPFGLGAERAFISDGSHTVILPILSEVQVCLVAEKVGDIDASFNGIEITGEGWTQTCMISSNQTMIIEASGGNSWINPTGLSGRGDQIFDETGLRLHWIELRSMNLE